MPELEDPDLNDVNVGVGISMLIHQNAQRLFSSEVTNLLRFGLNLTEEQEGPEEPDMNVGIIMVNFALNILEEEMVLQENWKELEISQKKGIFEALLKIDYAKEIEEGGRSSEVVKAVADVAVILENKKQIL